MDPYASYHVVGAPGARIICAALDGLRRALRDCETWSPGRYEVLMCQWTPSSEMHYTHWGVAIKHPDGSVELVPDWPA
jgi:hypothetical protein